jgi:hypothetical protein
VNGNPQSTPTSARRSSVARSRASVTHALPFLAQCDYIYTLDGGRIAEAGTYPELIACGGEFARLDRKFWGAKAEDAGGEGSAGENGDGDEAQVQVVSLEDALCTSWLAILITSDGICSLEKILTVWMFFALVFVC